MTLLAQILSIGLSSILRSGLFGDGAGVLCFVTSPINDSELLELIRALARATAREDHRKLSLEREVAPERREGILVVREKTG